jgi:hypothetical protein
MTTINNRLIYLLRMIFGVFLGRTLGANLSSGCNKKKEKKR